MISVENFYWVLYQNLLRPLEINAWYYYPWGTHDYLSRHEFDQFHRKYHLNHVLFYDQEPIWDLGLGKGYDHGDGAEWSTQKFLKILANSEQSGSKKQVCKNRNMLDWYYFYHGFAALDWYRDAEYIGQDYDIQNAFLCLNHIVQGQRSYRVSLLARLAQQNILDRGSVSFHADLDGVLEIIDRAHSEMSPTSRDLITNYITPATCLPRKLDDVIADGNLSAHFGYHEYRLWQRSLLHVVTETVFYEPKLHLTEKVFKPIVAQRPFILVAAPGNLRYLKSYGFQTFGSWIDESYDDIQDSDQRLDAIASEVARFAAMSIPELTRVHQDMQPVLAYNKHHFFVEFRRIIVNELVDNFDQCIRIWNNGRVDGRELPIHPDLDGAKKTLLA